ncbi:ribonuclease R [Anaeromyxobacter paludicola]|uniref:Ribonuclease R n=1 Tax=Anaeromyxobacter paludicola TaxID=2918171 RepID=A0ABM7X5W5_9BACT|nr:ribonuclease R [Anaeromyxobacter paludicola]BDG07207.1 ribonuclease R [Anaeromyxobacter paludicola]
MPDKDLADRRRERLVAQLREGAGQPASIGELMQKARIHPGERTEVKRVLRDLTREGLVLRAGKRFWLRGAEKPAAGPRSGGGRPSRPAAEPERRARPPAALSRGAGLLGTLTRHRDGYGFVARVDRAGEDVFVPPPEAEKALDGDLVRIDIVPGRDGRTMGRILEVVERRRRTIIGTYHDRGASSFVLPSDEQLEGPVPVPRSRLAVDGEVVKVALDPESRALEGEVVERVGRPGDPKVEVLKVAYAKGFSDLFPPEVRIEAQAIPDEVTPEDRRGRRDLTAMRLVTIDGEDARDFDDAVHVERLPGRKGYRLTVAIADVSHYVRRGSALDAEALRRGTSVYFPMQVLPMLPEKLSNGICSLNPEVDRLCMVADMTLDAQGRPVSAEIYEAVMRSAARCTYTDVARMLAGEKVPRREFLRQDFELMAELQEKLTGLRQHRGSIDFDLPEAKVVLDAAGDVLGIERRPRNRAHRIVEEFMLAANEAVARHFGSRSVPTIYRVHGEPDEEKLAAFLDLARTHGFEVPADEAALTPKALNALLARFEGHPQQRALNQLLLRSMMQAIYSPENIGHYGLAAEHYLHFTSPIRRYPDLVVHRLLREEWAAPVEAAEGEAPRGKARRGGRVFGRTSPAELERMAALASERERAAMQAEREIASFYAALFMKDKVGQRFPGVVASVVEFGLFVEIGEWLVEGLVKVEDLGEGFQFDPEQHALVQPGTGRAFRVGDELEIEVLAASPLRRQIDLGLVEGGEVFRGVPRERGGRGGGKGGRRERLEVPRAGGKAARHGKRDEGRPGKKGARAGGGKPRGRKGGRGR